MKIYLLTNKTLESLVRDHWLQGNSSTENSCREEEETDNSYFLWNFLQSKIYLFPSGNEFVLWSGDQPEFISTGRDLRENIFMEIP